MSLAAFRDAPWAYSNATYRRSALSLTPAPEYANSEVLVAGLYRTIGLRGISEGKVPLKGRELDRIVGDSRDRRKVPDNAALDGDAFQGLLRIILESPKLPNQSTKRFLQVSPLVGETALFSGSARLAGNSWPAGALIRRMILLGSPSRLVAAQHWQRLFDALRVEDSDDVFARFVRDELRAWTGEAWGDFVALDEDDVECLPAEELDGRPFPARQFVIDLASIVDAKSLMTRRQWTSLLEALVRMAAVAHVVWLCEVQKRAWDCLQSALRGDPVGENMPSAIYPERFGYLNYGTEAVSELKDRTSKYLRARLGINAVLWALQELKSPHKGDLSSARGVAELCGLVHENRAKLDDVLNIVSDVVDREARTLLCRKGIGSNLMEFVRHVLYQRRAADPRLRGYDQGYVLRQRGSAKSTRWICAPGPVLVLALVHCALAGLSGPRSIHRFAQHLAAYGIAVDHGNIAQNDLGLQLRMLGLVHDSPDAESGMLLVPPFAASKPLGGRDN